jgi:hypothetical protein
MTSTNAPSYTFSNRSLAFAAALAAFAAVHGLFVWLGFELADGLRSMEAALAIGGMQLVGVLLGAVIAGVVFMHLMRAALVGATKFQLVACLVLVGAIEATAVLMTMSYSSWIEALFASVIWYAAVGGFVTLGGLALAQRLMQRHGIPLQK